MRVLMIIGESINANSSTNIFKRILIDEISKNNDTTVIMDNNSQEVSKVVGYVKNGTTFIEFSRLLPVERIFGRFLNKKNYSKNINKEINTKYKQNKSHIKLAKKLLNRLYKKHIEICYPKYRYYTKWVQRATNYTSSMNFDVIMSVSHPPASHKVAADIILKGNVKYKKWIQVWFEPWFQVPFKKNKTKLIIEEERFLLKLADVVFYVNPIYFNKQKLIFPEYISKIQCIDLPVVINKKAETIQYSLKPQSVSVGYFGNYYSSIRNIEPFYKSIQKMDNVNFLIIGDSDLVLKPTNNLIIKSRVNHDQIQRYESQVDVLIILSNLSDQIPGKVYNYSSSNKYVLFILDGNYQTKRDLKKYFGQYNRYVFCENNEDDIKEKLRDIIDGNYSYVKNGPIQKFRASNIVNTLLNSTAEEKTYVQR